jgi:hypothetical protein
MHPENEPGFPELETMRARLIAGRYRLEEHLGAGAMGEVWRATDIELGRQVALKRSQRHDNGQIRREARIGAGLQHPNVITVFDAVVDDQGNRWLVTEYLPSRSLAEILETDGPLPPDQVAKIGAQLADAMAAMHAKGVVHRDIKPGNVLVAADGTAKLTDLGVAQWAEATLTGSAQICGTPGYLAPEVADGRAASSASDVFSLGATLFAAVEGASPWNGEDGPFAQLRRAVAYDLRPPRKAGALAPMLVRLMHKQPSARPTAEEAQGLLAGDTTVPKSSWRVSRRMVAIGAGVVALALVAGLVYGITGSSDANAPDTMGDLRTADPCTLLNPAWFSSFGAEFTFDSDSGNFNFCTLLVGQTSNPADVVEVEVEFRMPDDPNPVRPVAGRLVMPDRPPGDGGGCFRVFDMPNGSQTIVTARHQSDWHAPLCAVADEATKNILPILNRGQIPRRAPFPDGTLATVDACTLLHSDDIDPALGPGEAKVSRGFADWECYWNKNGKEVAVLYDREPLPSPESDQGELLRFAGRDVYVEPGDGGWGESCQAEVLHRRFLSRGREWVETVEVYLGEKGSTTPEQFCAGVTLLGQALAERLPAV